MGCLPTKICKKSPAYLVYHVPSEFDHIRPKGHILVYVDKFFETPVVFINFDDCNSKCVRIWSYDNYRRKYLNSSERVLSSPTLLDSEDSDSGCDTVF